MEFCKVTRVPQILMGSLPLPLHPSPYSLQPSSHLDSCSRGPHACPVQNASYSTRATAAQSVPGLACVLNHELLYTTLSEYLDLKT